MDNHWLIPHTEPQRDHVIPPIPERPDVNLQPNTPRPAQDTNTPIRSCSCQQCSDTRCRQPTWYPIEQQPEDQRNFGNFVTQGQYPDNRQETTLTAPDRVAAQIAHPQTVGIQRNFDYASVHGRAIPPNVALPQAPILEVSIAESRRRMAVFYLNNPDVHVSMIRLEPGPSGQSQVIIVVEMANIL